MTYFILGNNPVLSMAEIINVYHPKDFSYGKGWMIVNDKNEVNGEENFRSSAIDKLGGSIKVGKIIKEVKDDRNTIGKWLNEYVFELFEKGKLKKDQKFCFGFNVYSEKERKKDFVRHFAMNLKKMLKEEGVNSRWITSKEKTLSSVVARKNNLFVDKNGLEINLFISDDKVLIGENLAVQDFEKYSEMDYGRPKRDAVSGMLPPKLAKIMINLAELGENEVLLDPFCGSGTILQEALMSGYKRIIGSDFKKEVIESCEVNLEWLKKRMPKLETGRDLKLLNSSAEKISNVVPPESVNAIVTEPYLGPPVRPDSELDFEFIMKKLSKLYLKTFRQFYKILKKNGVVVMILPVFKVEDKEKGTYYKFLTIEREIEEIGFVKERVLNKNLAEELKELYGKHTISKRKTVIYSRANQYVLREVVKFRKRG